MSASSRPRWAAAEPSASERLGRTTMGADDSASKAETATDPEDSRKPDSPTEITRPAWKFVIRRTIHEFSWDQCTTLAAALTYYGVLSLFPGLLALVIRARAVRTGRGDHSDDRRDSPRIHRPQRRRSGPRADRTAGQRPGRRPGLCFGVGRSHLVGLRVRRRLRPGHEPHL